MGAPVPGRKPLYGRTRDQRLRARARGMDGYPIAFYLHEGQKLQQDWQQSGDRQDTHYEQDQAGHADHHYCGLVIFVPGNGGDERPEHKGSARPQPGSAQQRVQRLSVLRVVSGR